MAPAFLTVWDIYSAPVALFNELLHSWRSDASPGKRTKQRAGVCVASPAQGMWNKTELSLSHVQGPCSVASPFRGVACVPGVLVAQGRWQGNCSRPLFSPQLQEYCGSKVVPSPSKRGDRKIEVEGGKGRAEAWEPAETRGCCSWLVPALPCCSKAAAVETCVCKALFR